MLTARSVAVGPSARPVPVRQQVLGALDGLPALTPVRPTALRRRLRLPEDHHHALRWALQDLTCCGEPPRSRVWAALRLDLRLAAHLPPRPVVLSLPRLDVAVIRLDALASRSQGEVALILEHLREKYGEIAIRVWARSAARRSVDFSPGMREARQAPHCRLCMVVADLQRKASQPITLPRPGTACHLISRHATFWQLAGAIDLRAEAEGLEMGLFSNRGARLLQDALLASDLHSSPRYILPLCARHDALIQTQLHQAAVGGG